MVEAWEKWMPVVDALVLQTYYRQLSWVSIPGPIEDVYKAAEHLSETTRGGKLYWVLEGRVARWDDFEVYPEIVQTNWFIGGSINTAMARRGWWSMYLMGPMVKSVARVFGTWRPELEKKGGSKRGGSSLF